MGALINPPRGGAVLTPADREEIAQEGADAIRTQVAADADRAEAAAGAVPALSAAVQGIEDGAPLVDGSLQLVTVPGAGDVMRLAADGVDFVPSMIVADRVLEDRGMGLGPLLADGGRDMLTYNGSALMRLYPDGLDFKRHASLTDQYLADAGRNGLAAVDTFDDARGVKLPTAAVDGMTRKAIIVSVYGQSNADCTEMDDALLWTAPPMPRHILMLDDVAGARGGLRGYLGVPAPGGAGLVPARENAVVVNGHHVQSYATAAAARLNALRGASYRMAAVRSSAVGGTKLIGDAAGSGIWKDSVGAYTQTWSNWSQDLRDLRSGLVALGYEVEAIYICFTHQEADWQTPRLTYRDNFLGMKADREAQIATDLPGIPVRWFVDQASGSGLRTGSYLGGAWPDRMAIQDAVMASGNMTMVMPRYHMRFGFNGGAREDIHHAHYDRILQGETYAHAMREIEAGRQWRCPWPTGASVSGNSIVIDFDSLRPLVLDPTFCKVRADMGFVVGGGAIAVTSVTLTGQRQVTVTCASSPAGSTITYAYRQQDGQDVSDEWPISTGALRDAWVAPSMFLPGERLIRAALGFQIQL